MFSFVEVILIVVLTSIVNTIMLHKLEITSALRDYAGTLHIDCHSADKDLFTLEIEKPIYSLNDEKFIVIKIDPDPTLRN